MEKAESILLEIRAALKTDNSDDIKRLSTEFYAQIPMKTYKKLTIASIRDVAIKQDLCQVKKKKNYGKINT